MILTLYDWLANFAAFQFHFVAMALAVDVIDKHGPSSKMHCPLQTKVMLYYALYNSKRRFIHPSLLTRCSVFVLIVDVLHGWQSI